MEAQPVFIQVGALADGFAPDSHILPALDHLTGRTLRLHGEDGSITDYTFASGTTLQWQRAGRQGSADYRATSLRPGLYFVDFIEPAMRATTTSLVLDLEHGLFTAVIGTLPTEQEAHLDAFSRVGQGLELTGVAASFVHGTIDRPLADGEALHHTTDELVGLRNQYIYSHTERYEHIYLNDNFYAWQCLDGVEKGLADVDRCHYFKLADALYLFVWREKIIPTLGVILIDLERKKTDGKIVGYRGDDFAELSNFPVGALAQVLNRTEYPKA